MKSLFFSSVRLEEGPGHDFVSFWQNGANNGRLALTKGTGRVLLTLMKDLVDTSYIREDNHT